MFDQVASARHYGDMVIRCNIILIAITTVTLLVRLWAKLSTKARLGLDDVFMILAQCSWYVTAAISMKAAYVGKNLKDFMDPKFADLTLYAYLGGCLYFPTVLFISLSILSFYRRIFNVQEFKRIVDVFIAIHVAFTIAAGLPSIFMCTPMHIAWSDAITFITNIDKCINYPAYFLSVLIIELVLNAVVLALPIRETMKLKLDFHTKWMLACVFLLGGVSIISGIVRVQQSYIPGDKFIDLTGDMFWISIHEATALIAASLPIYRPLIRSSISFMSSSFRKMSGPGSYGSNSSHKQSGSHSAKGYLSAPSVNSQKELVDNESNANEVDREIHMMNLKEQRGTHRSYNAA